MMFILTAVSVYSKNPYAYTEIAVGATREELAELVSSEEVPFYFDAFGIERCYRRGGPLAACQQIFPDDDILEVPTRA